MKRTGISNSIIAAAAGAAGLVVRDLTHASAKNIPGYVYAIAAAVVVSAVLHSLVVLPSAFGFWRSLTRDERKFEGDWIETVEKAGQTYYTIFSIMYLWRTDTYAVSGLSLDVNGNVHADWDSLHIEFSHDTYELKFLFLARQVGKENMVGYTEISFVRPPSGSPSEGKGYFVDMSLQPIRVEYRVERVDNDLKRKLVGKPIKVLRGDTRKAFIKAYHRIRTENR